MIPFALVPYSPRTVVHPFAYMQTTRAQFAGRTNTAVKVQFVVPGYNILFFCPFGTSVCCQGPVTDRPLVLFEPSSKYYVYIYSIWYKRFRSICRIIIIILPMYFVLYATANLVYIYSHLSWRVEKYLEKKSTLPYVSI